MQPQTADDRPNILADIKHDHASFWSLHRRFQEELSEHDKQLTIWQVRSVCAPSSVVMTFRAGHHTTAPCLCVMVALPCGPHPTRS